MKTIDEDFRKYDIRKYDEVQSFYAPDFDKDLYQVSKYARQPKRLEDLFLRMKEVEQSLSREE